MRNITFNLGDDPQKLIGQIENRIKRREAILRERVAARLRELVEANFVGAVVDDLIGEPQRIANVTVTYDQAGDKYVVTANGKDAVWVEFGAGVYHNGAIGQSPNPMVAENGLPFTIGSFSFAGLASRDVWGFYDESGNLHLTHGTPAAMPMYNAVQTLISEIPAIAQEVFAK